MNGYHRPEVTRRGFLKVIAYTSSVLAYQTGVRSRHRLANRSRIFSF